MQPILQPVWQQWLLGVATAGIVLIILVQGRYFLIPLAIAVFLFTLTSAALDRLARLRIGPMKMPKWLAHLISILLTIAAMLLVFRIVAGQIDAVTAAGPIYVERGQQFVTSMFIWMGEDAAAGIVAAFEEIDLGAYIRALAGSVGYILATGILVLLYVGFLFAERARFPDKFAMLLPEADRADRIKRIFRSITHTINRYILIKSIISVFTGVVAYVVMMLFGLEFAETWALLTVFLNFIPNIGSIIATLIPTLAALVQFDTWIPVLLLFTTIGLIQFSVGNLIEPTLMGRSLNLSPFVIILSLTFWGAIWGVIGMFLAVPITMIVLIVCSHIPALHPIAILLSRDGVVIPMDETQNSESPRETEA